MSRDLGTAKENTSTTGSSADFVLTGAIEGYKSFAVLVGDGNACDYAVVGDGGQWEARLGVYHAATNSLSRSGYLHASSTGSSVNFTAGVKQVFLDVPVDVISDIASVPTSGGGGGSSSGTIGLVQLSDGAGGFSSDAGLSYDSGSGILAVAGVKAPAANDLALSSADGSSILSGKTGASVTVSPANTDEIDIVLGDGVSGMYVVVDSVNPVTANGNDLGAVGGAWRTGYFGTSVVTPLVQSTPVTLTSLGSAATAGAGTRAFISDGATLGTWGATAVGGGSVKKPVFSDGTNWCNG